MDGRPSAAIQSAQSVGHKSKKVPMGLFNRVCQLDNQIAHWIILAEDL